MRLWAGAAHFTGYDASVSAHYVLAADEAEAKAKAKILEEASVKWPKWWRNYPNHIYVVDVPDEVAAAVTRDLR